MLVGAVGAKKFLPKILDSLYPSKPSTEAIASEKYSEYLASSSVTEEQNQPARALLVSNSLDGRDGDYRLNHWLMGGFLLDRGLSNDNIYFFEPNSDIPLTETKAYRNFLIRNKNNPDLLRVMDAALEDLVVDGPANYEQVISGLEDTVSNSGNAILGFFSARGFGNFDHRFSLGQEELGSSEINQIINQIGNLENSIFMGVGNDSPMYASGIRAKNMLEVNAGTNYPGTKFMYVVEDMINAYFQNPEQSVTDVYNKVLRNTRKITGSFRDAYGKTHGVDVVQNPEGFKFDFDKLILEGGVPGDVHTGKTEGGVVYKSLGSDNVSVIDPETGRPYELNFTYKSFNDFLGVKN